MRQLMIKIIHYSLTPAINNLDLQTHKHLKEKKKMEYISNDAYS